MATAVPGAGDTRGVNRTRDAIAGLFDRIGWGVRRAWRWSLESSHLYRWVRRLWRLRFTARGRYLFLLCWVVGFAGLDTRQALVYQLFAFAFGPLAVAAVLALRRPPRVRLTGEIPRRLTAGRPVSVGVTLEAESSRESLPLVVSWMGPSPQALGVRVVPGDTYLQCGPGGPGHGRVEVEARERGRYVVPGLAVGRTDPLGLMSTARTERQASRVVLAYPRFFHLDGLTLPVGRRYQPGGIPLASSLGDSIEFVGTREYREGDPLRRIHWRSWARRGKPVVKEYQEEYFSRIALVLDTFIPPRPRRRDRRRFEAGISVLASIADHFSRSEEVVDIFAAGPDIYEVSAGRSLAYLENVLDVLSCLEPCHQPPFEAVGPRLHETLARLTTVVAVVLDWDEAREAFLRRIRSLGVAVRTFLVHDGRTARPWEPAARELGPITVLSPEEVDRRVEAAEVA